MTLLVELGAEVRKATETRQFDRPAGPVSAEQAASLEWVLPVPEGQRRSQLVL